MSNAIAEARQRWIAEREEYEAFGLYLKSSIQAALREVGVYAELSVRAKEVHSLVKKLLAKKHLSYDTLPDRVGARITVRLRSELPKVQDAIAAKFRFVKADDKSVELKTDRVGYQSIHIDGLALADTDSEIQRFPSERFFAEVQLRTHAQHLWSELSHDAFYKNDATVTSIPDDLLRRLNLMAGLIEVADREFDKMTAEIPTDEAVALYRGLEPYYYRLCAVKPNADLSLTVINLLRPLYGNESTSQILNDHIAKTFQEAEGMLHHVYDDPDLEGPEKSVFVNQPEALLIYDRLLADRDSTLSAWNQEFPPEELEKVATLFGISLD